MAHFDSAALTGRVQTGTTVLVLLNRSQRAAMGPIWARLAAAAIRRRVGRG